MTVKTTDAVNGVVNLASIETVNIENAGVTTITTLTTTSASTLNVSGSGTITLSNIDDASLTVNMAIFQAHQLLMVLRLELLLLLVDRNDTINFDGLTLADTIDAGAGTDTLVLTAATNSFATSTAAGDVTVSE